MSVSFAAVQYFLAVNYSSLNNIECFPSLTLKNCSQPYSVAPDVILSPVQSIQPFQKVISSSTLRRYPSAALQAVALLVSSNYSLLLLYRIWSHPLIRVVTTSKLEHLALTVVSIYPLHSSSKTRLFVAYLTLFHHARILVGVCPQQIYLRPVHPTF